jgi:hypothetical protein
VQNDNKNLRLKLWYCTPKALRLLTNLKQLCFKPSMDHPSAPSLFKSCIFKLESFTWMYYRNQERLFEEFLPTQPGLLHLDIDFDNHDNKKYLPDNLCPSLVSVASKLSVFFEDCSRQTCHCIPCSQLLSGEHASSLRRPKITGREAAMSYGIEEAQISSFEFLIGLPTVDKWNLA